MHPWSWSRNGGDVPVSYTHLDVYKRQGINPSTKATITIPAKKVAKFKACLLYTSRIGPVPKLNRMIPVMIDVKLESDIFELIYREV